MSLPEVSIVSVYLNLMTLLMMAGLICLSRRVSQRKNLHDRIFFILCQHVMVYAFGSALCYALYYQPYAWAPTAELIIRTLSELVLLHLIYHWVLFVDYILYRSREHLVRRFRPLYLPVLVFSALLLVNLFTGILFSVTEDNLGRPTILYFIMAGVELFYFLQPIGMVLRFRHNGGRLHFFHVTPVILSAFIGGLADLLTPYSTAALGLSVGLLFLYFTMMSAWRFEDSQTGQFNREYLRFIGALAHGGKRDLRSVLLIESAQDPAVLAGILGQEIPRDGQMIYLGNGRFALILEVGERSALNMLQLMIREAVDEYDRTHDGAETDLKLTCLIRRRDEDVKAFLETVSGMN